MAQIDDRLFNIDRNGSLRPPGVFWLALAFLARHWILVMVVFGTAKRSPEVVRLLGHDFSWMVLPLELPVIALMVTAANRAPSGGAWLRAIWRHGRAIVLATACAHIAWAGYLLAVSDNWYKTELMLASCCLLDFAIVWAFRKDPYYALLFNDFPAPAPAVAPEESPKT